MSTITRILWPTDFSDLSRKALPVVTSMARQFAARVDVLHVVPPPPTFVSMGGPQAAVGLQDFWTSLDEQAKTRLAELLDDEGLAGLNVSSALMRGDPARSIVDFARDNDVDLVIISTHGETGLSRLVFGSVAEKVVRLSDRLVLTVPSSDRAE